MAVDRVTQIEGLVKGKELFSALSDRKSGSELREATGNSVRKP